MSMQSEGKGAKGRNWDQATKNGSSSAATMGAGGTGDIGRMSGNADAGMPGKAREGAPGNAQSDTRTDDWLSSGTEQERERGFRPSDPEALKTGMEGIGQLSGNLSGGKAGNRQ